MSLFPSLPNEAHLADVYKAFPEHVRPILQYHDELLRGPSPLSVAERELIAAYVSGLNACRFCFGAHKVIAKAFGMDEMAIDALVEDVDKAPVDPNFKPILKYVGKLTREPAKMAPSDAEAVFAAGWNERALFDSIQVCALFNYMNRIVDGVGVTFDYGENPPSDEDIKARQNRSYMDWGREIGVI